MNRIWSLIAKQVGLQLILFAVSMIMLILMVSIGFQYTSSSSRLTKNLDEMLMKIGGRMQSSLVGPLWDMSPEAIENIIAAEMQEKARIIPI